MLVRKCKKTYQDSSTTEGLLSARAGDRKDKIMGKLET